MKRILGCLLKLDWGLVVILLSGLVLRFWGIGFGLPYTYASDEPSYLMIVLQMIKMGDLNPHWWLYPTLMFYLNTVVFLLYFLIGRAAGIFTTLADFPVPEVVTMGVGRLSMPGEFLVARGLTALASTVAIVIVYLIGRRLHPNREVALLAALLLTVSPTVIEHSYRIGPDVFAMLFALVSYLFAMRIADEPKMRYYVLAGIGAGLAVASKYNAGLILIPLVVVHFLRFGLAGLTRKALYVGLGVTVLTFIIVTPFALLDFPRFWEGVRFQAFSYTTEGHAGQEGNALQWYTTYLWQVEGLVVLLGAVSGLSFLFTRSKKHLVLVSFPIFYFLFVSQLLIRNARTIMLILPFLDLLAALLVVDVSEWLTNARRLPRLGARLGALAVCVWMVIFPLRTSVAADMRLTQIDSRETSRVWLEANLPAGARVAEEGYSPYLDTRRFVIQGVDAMVDHSPEWYVQNGFEYLVFSQGMYARFFAEPRQYGIFVEKYNEFFNRFLELKHFDDNGYEIRIYKTGVTLPNHRVAARFGDYGDVIELVGYEHAKWMQGEPFRINLFWRTLRATPEPLEVDLRLLDRNDQAVATMRDDLFQDVGWREGIFATEWMIPVPTDAAPGLYRLDVTVIQTRYAYRTPIMNWAEEKVERMLLGPVKLAVSSPAPSELQAACPANVRWGDQIASLGYNIGIGRGRADEALALTFYWQALAKPTRDYTVFVHLLDAAGKLCAQIDAQPRGGAYPTSVWDAGEIVRDDYVLTLPGTLTPGAYRIEIGFYEYPSLARLNVTDANGQVQGDHWALPDSIQVVR